MSCLAAGCLRRPASFSEKDVADHPEWLRLQIHDAELRRSFAKVGAMDPYVVVFADGLEVCRIAAHKRGHRAPAWEAPCAVRAARAPAHLVVAVRSANPFGKDVLCGEAEVPWSAGEEGFAGRALRLVKRGASTGTVRVSLTVVAGPAEEPAEAPTLLSPSRSRNHSEIKSLDAIIRDHSPKADGALGPAVLAPTPSAGQGAVLEAPDADDAPSLGKGDAASPEAPACRSAEVLAGSWTCVATQGLEDFLKATGVGMMQRKLAMSARWPAWDFAVSEGGRISFVNHSQLGDLKEEIVLDSTYDHKDGRGNPLTCTAEWNGTTQGGCLVICRRGNLGNFREERRVEGDTLTFVLTDGSGASWGRTFKRA